MKGGIALELISIIVPVYNVENEVSRCIESILAQKYTNIEVILVNDGSSDKSAEICEQYEKMDSRVHLINKENGGVSSARNKGLEKANGSWICFVDSDDYVSDDYITNFTNSLGYTYADIVCCGVVEKKGYDEKNVLHNIGMESSVVVNNITDFICTLIDNKEHSNKGINAQLLGYPVSKLYKRSVIKDIAFNEKIRIREDALFNIEAFSRAKKIAVNSHVGYYYVIREDSAMGRYYENYLQEVISYLTYVQKLWQELKLPIDSYYVGVLYAYMMWLKLSVFHPKSDKNIKEKTTIIRESFAVTCWKEAFHNVDEKDLPLHYKLLYFCYRNKWVKGICLLFYISRLR